jgi:cyclopropane fatty-acyl-phospholipid synthase-like methyltransferase
MTVIDDVRAYYETNTRRFERFGQGGGTIHRAVWGDGVRTRDEAFRHVDELVARELASFTERGDIVHVLDLGCGVGASLVFLASRADIRGTGATLSGLQATRAREHARRAGLEGRVTFLEANFLDLPSDLPKAELAFSIEAFIHGPDPRAYFEAASRYLVPGGALVVCDDFLTDAGRAAPSEPERRVLEDVRNGWLANTLVTTAEAAKLAARSGLSLRKDLDLTPFLELGRPRDRLIAALVALGRRLPREPRGFRWRSLVGGSALQTALGTGLVAYRFLVFENRGRGNGAA